MSVFSRAYGILYFTSLQTTVEEALKDGAPDGVDCFFDNVGGRDSAVIINHMNLHGRVSVCGAISTYNAEEPEMVPATSFTFVVKVN